MQAKREVVVVFHDHVDPVWARCADRLHKYNTDLIRSNMEVFDWIVSAFLELEKDGLCLTEGQVVLWEPYLQRKPELRERVRQLVRDGKLEFLRHGLMNIDSNCSPAEGLARNHLLADPFYRKYTPEGYWATKLAFLWDAFGNSANMPQVLKLSGCEVIGGTKYRLCPDDYWVGIDGTKLPCIDQIFSSYNRVEDPILYVLSRHPHCPSCHGRGCPECEGRGIVNKHPIFKDKVLDVLERTAAFGDPKKFVMIGGEEAIPDHNMMDAIAELNAKYRGEILFRCGTLTEFWEYHSEHYRSVADNFTEPTVDLNPVNQGSYVTRIESKQRTRAISYALIQAEALLARAQWHNGQHEAMPEDLKLAWNDAVLNMHHDALSGSHIDGNHDELMELLDEAESIAYGYTYRKKVQAKRSGDDRSADGPRTKQLGKMNVTYDLKGITAVEKNGEDLFGQLIYHGMPYTGLDSDPIHIGELILEDEVGDHLQTMFTADKVMLGRYNYVVYEGEDFLWWRGRRDVMDPRAPLLAWDVYVKASPDGERLDFSVDVDWDTYNRRLKVVVPVNDQGSFESTWEIPYGFIKRSYDPSYVMERPKVENDSMTTAEYDYRAIAPVGDYPALHWVRHDIDDKRGVALLNKGLPCVKWLPGSFELSLLRSPEMHGITVLHEEEEVWDIKGNRDSGRHHFDFAVYPYTDGLSNGDLTRTGYAYNDAAPQLPFAVEGDVVCTAFKPAEDGNGLILRLQEAGGTAGSVRISFEKTVTATPSNLLEQPLEDGITGAVYERTLHKHEILTLRLQ